MSSELSQYKCYKCSGAVTGARAHNFCHPATFRGRNVLGGSLYPRVYWPEHQECHDGRVVYIHRVVALEKFGELPDNYHVHHLDEDKWNWCPDNLDLLPASDHIRDHKGGMLEILSCSKCGTDIPTTITSRKNQMDVFCSDTCQRSFYLRANWPPLEELVLMVQASSYCAVGRELGVSDNAVRKHIRTRT